MKTKILLFTILLTMMFIPFVNAEFNLTHNNYEDFIQNADKVVIRYGRTFEMDTSMSVVWCSNGELIFQDTAQRIEIVSTSVNDVYGGSGAWNVYLKGLDENYTEIEEIVQLNGLTPVYSVNNFLRLHDGIMQQSGSVGTNDGDITFNYEITGDETGLALAGNGRCTGSYWTVPKGKTAIFIQGGAGSDESRRTIYKLYYRPYNKSWVLFGEASLYRQIWIFDYPNVFYIPEKTDIVMMGATDVSSANAYGYLTFYLLDNEDLPQSTITGNAGVDANLFTNMLLLIVVSLDIFMMVRKR